MLSASDDDEADSRESNLMQFPAHDEASLHEMMQQCIMKAALLHNSAIAEPSPYINHWSHDHQLALGSKNAKTSTPYLNWKLEDTELLICDGCSKPIFLVDDVFYECNSCKFFLHRCQGCTILSNGIVMLDETARFDIGCASLPRIIKHEGHRHPLNQLKYADDNFCKACWLEAASERDTFMYGCEKCGFYLHIRCALRPHLMKHRWGPHPLCLILFVKNVPGHPQAFECEFCSETIDAKTWFYHCNACDLSFHMACIDPYYRLSNMKLGTTNIYSDSHPHSHGLTWVLNKKKRRCNICDKDSTLLPVLECSPCGYIVHVKCFIKK
ncbi:hypothetical protein POM88_028698 [Heracleum sosnowskyi]|uniref:C2H2-type domain-containing protein n=1 Tax=Heracleum sosnowskyi TaxID=360622 RepID=A0AAD8HUU9_9APIA|nr:hypothetical protein POM88_028698 [Heracleum sosnowskyi]